MIDIQNIKGMEMIF